MKRSKLEAEVIVRLDYADQKAHICVCQWPAMAARMRKRYGPSLDPNAKFSERWVVPLNAVSFRKAERKPKTPRQVAVLASGVPRKWQSSHSGTSEQKTPREEACG